MSTPLTIACTHDPEVHVLYDPEGAGFRAEVRCRCRKVVVTLSKIRDRVDLAEADGAALMALARRNGVGVS
jgi:hypothetical protein